jgi:hypothetical protein
MTEKNTLYYTNIIIFQHMFEFFRSLLFYWGVWNANGNHQPATLFTEKLYYITLYRVHLTMTRFELTTLVVINTDYTDSCISNIS